MPHFTVAIAPPGALLPVLVGISGPRAAAMVAQGEMPLPPTEAYLQIDTGSARTAVDQRIIDGLGLKPTGSVRMNTPSSGPAGVDVNTYDVSLIAVGLDMVNHLLGSHEVVASDFSGQALAGLLGRDILASARLVYSGPDRVCFLSV